MPWSVVLTMLFVVVGSVSVWAWVSPYARGVATSDPDLFTHANHAVMSVVMIAMIWWPPAQLGQWVQAGIFGIFALAQLRPLPAVRAAVDRIDLLSHVVMNLAMGWMLLAMPMLMGHGAAGSGGEHAQHGGAAATGPAEVLPTPLWAEALNVVAIVACVAVAAWWLVRLSRPGRRRLHDLCHALGAAGMAAMLGLM